MVGGETDVVVGRWIGEGHRHVYNKWEHMMSDLPLWSTS